MKRYITLSLHYDDQHHHQCHHDDHHERPGESKDQQPEHRGHLRLAEDGEAEEGFPKQPLARIPSGCSHDSNDDNNDDSDESNDEDDKGIIIFNAESIALKQKNLN